jgi:hypothetical protein
VLWGFVNLCLRTLLAVRSEIFAYPYTLQTDSTLKRLASLKPQTIAVMHGSSFCGDGEVALNDLAAAMKDVLGNV